MKLLYLDYNCFQRGFDDQRQIRIQIEALACQQIFLETEEGKIEFIWSFMHDDESILCPFPERRYEVLRLAGLANVHIGPEQEIYELAKDIQKTGNLSSKDAIHLACAVYSKADAFLTCDDKLIKNARRLKLEIKIMNPVDYVREEDFV